MRLRRIGWAFAALMVPSTGFAACNIAKIAELPVTMAGRQPLVVGQFAGRDTRFILDSGAIHNLISRATATEFGLKTIPAPAWFRIAGIGGDTSAGIAETKTFALAGIPIPGADFVVGGSETGTAGLIGQDILGLADVEYDLPHGIVRLIRSSGCARTSLAYWAGSKPVVAIALQTTGGPFKPHTVATIAINGVKVRAIFDTGAGSSLLSLAAAKRAGVTPDSPGVVPGGFSRGVGTRSIKLWRAKFDKIDVGGEAISGPTIDIGDVVFGDGDMLIGIDFFLTHRIFVSNTNHMMFITYEGGPVFGLSPKNAVSADGKTIDLTDTAATPTDAEGFSRRGAVLASNHKIDAAIADFDKACAMAPKEGRYFYQRAIARLNNRQPTLALTDLDTAIMLAPDNADAHLARARLKLSANDQNGAGEDVRAADHALPTTSDKRLIVAGLYEALYSPEPAITNYDLWLQSHREDVGRASAFNGRCWARAILNRDLDKALADCDAALRLTPKNAAYLDSRALVHLRRGENANAIDDYDEALAVMPKNAWSLYGRSIAAKRAGNAAQSGTDRKAALAINPRVAERAHKLGLED